MKLLGNAWVVGVLCVAAVGVVGYQVLPARRPAATVVAAGNPPPLALSAPTSNVSSGIPVEQTPDPPASTSRTSQGTNTAAQLRPVDLAYLQSHFAQWVESPRRDPFLLPLAAKAAAVTNSSVFQWKLKAIWRQTGSRLAAINDRVYAEGDEISGYRLDQIDSDRVWFQGPSGRECLRFTNPGTAGNTKASPHK